MASKMPFMSDFNSNVNAHHARPSILWDLPNPLDAA
jgi:hypothetical protein